MSSLVMSLFLRLAALVLSLLLMLLLGLGTRCWNTGLLIVVEVVLMSYSEESTDLKYFRRTNSSRRNATSYLSIPPVALVPQHLVPQHIPGFKPKPSTSRLVGLTTDW